MKKRKFYFNAFTLAEVLITLMILGVIAMITIPNLTQKYKKHEVEVGLKVAYSLLSKALTIAQASEGSLSEMVDACYTGGREYAGQTNCFMDNYLKPNLKYEKSCAYGDENCSGVFPYDAYKGIDGTIKSGVTAKILNYSTLKLSNGILIGIYWRRSVAPQFLVDVNGANGPNQIGTDLFDFTLEEDDASKGLIVTVVSKGLKCGFTANSLEPADWYRDEKYYSCLIMHNNWKIPDDYPVNL